MQGVVQTIFLACTYDSPVHGAGRCGAAPRAPGAGCDETKWRQSEWLRTSS